MNAFKQQCIELRRKDYSLNEIVRITGRGKTSVYFHIKDIPLSQRKQKQIAEHSRQLALRVAAARKGKALRPIRPFVEWTPDLVLLVGHLMFDGELKRSCVYNNRSAALITRVTRLMQCVYDFPPYTHLDPTTGVHRISYHNVELAVFLKSRSLELKSIVTHLPIDFQREFLRAFFDDEGCMDFHLNRNSRRVRGYQNDREILVLVQNLLLNFGIRAILQGRNEVVIYGKAHLKKFQEEINFSKGVRINPNRTNSIWKKSLEKRALLDMAIKSFKY